MCRETEETYLSEHLDNDQIESIINILSDGVYEHLKRNGYLRSNQTRDKRIKKLLHDTRNLANSNSEENMD